MFSVSNSTYWEGRYQQGNTGWDLGAAAPPFVRWLATAQGLIPGDTAVLGCGRGYEALLFANYGFKVIGFDFAPSAISTAKSLAQDIGSNAQFREYDIFDLPKEFANYFDYVLEHTCFCAIAPEKRPEYIKLVHSLLKPQGELIGLFFTHNRVGGPPFGITPTEIVKSFQTDFEILALNAVTHSTAKRSGEEHFGHFRRK